MAFDFGSTTSKAIEASASVLKSAVTGRMELASIHTIWRSEPVLTPFSGDLIDQNQLAQIVEGWLNRNGATKNAGTVSGGVIITGLAAQKRNATVIAHAIRQRMGDAVVALADEPVQESWLAFMGSCSDLSGLHADRRFVNIDIGGGTSNLAIGQNRTVLEAGSLWIGARHFCFEQGTYRLISLSQKGQKVLRQLRITEQVGAELSKQQVETIAEFYVGGLINALQSKPRATFKILNHVPLKHQLQAQDIITFSGGVGELVYRIAQGERFPVTPYGDLGIDLAQAIVNSKILGKNLKNFVPENLGRATVCGLAFHGVEVSGATLFAPQKPSLPLRDLPILGKISKNSSQQNVNQLISRARNFPGGSCILASAHGGSMESIQSLASRLLLALKKTRFPNTVPLIIFLPENMGKTLGHYATAWGRLPVNLMVVDEIDVEAAADRAYFASVFKSEDQNVLVSFYGGVGEHSKKQDR